MDSKDVTRWHSLDHYDLTEILEKEEINWINIGCEEEEGDRNVQFEGFRSFADRKKPKDEQFCLLIMKDGGLAAGRWNKWRNEAGGAFIYSSALARGLTYSFTQSRGIKELLTTNKKRTG